MAFTPTPAPTPNLPKNSTYVGSYGQGYVAPKVLGTTSYSSGPNASMMPIGPQKPANWTPAPTTRINNTQTLNQSSGSGFVMPETQLQSPDDPFGGGPSETDVINQQFETFNSYLNEQEGMANRNFADTKSLFDTQKANAETQYATERDTQTEGIKKNESLNLSKVRQLLSDLQQSNSARTAITGGGSSAGEALSERFGRRAQEGMGNVMNQAETAIQRVSQFYNDSITKLNESYQANLLNAKQTLDENLSNIQYQRNASANAKQSATLDAWRSYYDNVNQAKLQAAQFKQQYDMWKQQQDNAYGAWSGNLQNTADQYNQGVKPSMETGNYRGTGLNLNNQQNINPFFRTGKSQEEDPLYPYSGGGYLANTGLLSK
jgi:hypothetical protein